MIEPENRFRKLICRGITSGCCSLCALWIVAVENFGSGGRGLVTTKKTASKEQEARTGRPGRPTNKLPILTTTTTTTQLITL